MTQASIWFYKYTCPENGCAWYMSLEYRGREATPEEHEGFGNQIESHKATEHVAAGAHFRDAVSA